MYIEDPIQYVLETNGLLQQQPSGTNRTAKKVEEMNRALSATRSEEINHAAPVGEQQWNEPEEENNKENTKRKTKSAKSGKNGQPGL